MRALLLTSDTAATRYLFAAAAWLAIGSLTWLAAMLAMRFPGLLPLTFGRLRPMAMIALGLGWLVLGLEAAIFYLLPRLTGAPLALEKQLNRALPLLILIVAAAMAIVGLGLGDGREPFALPWWLDLPVLGLTALALGPTMLTLSKRQEGMVYPSLWFALVGVLWLPVLYLAGNLPGLSALGIALSDALFSAGFLNVWAVGVATGAAYYVVPKVSGQPLANRQLARVGFWSLAFGAVWMGVSQFAAGPQPEWLGGIGGVLGLALPVAGLANTTNLAMTIGQKWPAIGAQPVLKAALAGSSLVTLGSLLAALAGFRSASVLVGLTLFWEGVWVLILSGVALLFGAFAWQAVPNLVGRSVDRSTHQVVKRLSIGGVGTGLLLVLAGYTSGVAWSGAGFSGAFETTGAGWSAGVGLAGIFSGLALAVFVYLTWGMIGLALTIYRALTSGKATVQEVLVVKQT
ncbi:MAG: cbb3-type cytochrome c oxidase subunit I [Acidimicrobiia bacterium]